MNSSTGTMSHGLKWRRQAVLGALMAMARRSDSFPKRTAFDWHIFDPVLKVHSSLVDPLPHQITAVYEAMLPRQPLRFLLADDPVWERPSWQAC
ncbi:MAG: hypothetical protein R3F31_23430 [Verrucomicrobiales bacterium]